MLANQNLGLMFRMRFIIQRGLDFMMVRCVPCSDVKFNMCVQFNTEGSDADTGIKDCGCVLISCDPVRGSVFVP